MLRKLGLKQSPVSVAEPKNYFPKEMGVAPACVECVCIGRWMLGGGVDSKT